MADNSNLKNFHSFLLITVYFYMFVDFTLFIFFYHPALVKIEPLLIKIHKIPCFHNVLYMKLTGLFLLMMVGIGSESKKQQKISWIKHILIPCFIGAVLYFSSMFVFEFPHKPFSFTVINALYIILTLSGAILLNVAFDNVSKRITSKLGKDFFNIENETWMQETKKIENPYSVNIQTKFYYQGKDHEGWLNIVNPFRGNMVLGIPNSGKTFGVILPYIRQLMAKEFAMLIYDYKFPDLYNLCYANYLLNKKQGKLKKHRFAILDCNDVSHSVRVNPIAPKYLSTLAECAETSEAIVEALKKGGKGGGSDQFFTQSAINLLTCVIYFLLNYEKGKYCTIPHAISMLNKDYEVLFKALFSMPELTSLLSPFANAYINKTFDQLEGQIGTLKINIGRIASKESYWIFSDDGFNLDINNKESPAIFILANDPKTVSINGAFYSAVINRITPLINVKNKTPSLIALDELPTLYFHKLEHLLATARSNKVAIVMGVQDLPQLKLNWSADTSRALMSIIGNIFCGIVRDKDTLTMMEQYFGKVNQSNESLSIDQSKTSISLSERMDSLMQPGKISSLKTGEMIGILGQDTNDSNKFVSSAFSAKIIPDQQAVDFEAKFDKKPPVLIRFESEKQKDDMLMANFLRIYKEVDKICEDIMEMAM